MADPELERAYVRKLTVRAVVIFAFVVAIVIELAVVLIHHYHLLHRAIPV
jgi:hypothetical protein